MGLAVILFGILLTFDISRSDSLLRSWFGTQTPQRNQPRELIDTLRRSR